jgi:Fe-S cluster biogenesis protein NfuA
MVSIPGGTFLMGGCEIPPDMKEANEKRAFLGQAAIVPACKGPDPEAERRSNLTPEMQKIEEILDKRIRPGLQGDGGDLMVKDFKDNVLIVKYQGACGTCPSSTTGTLEAIRSILRDEFHPEVEVYLAPEV